MLFHMWEFCGKIIFAELTVNCSGVHCDIVIGPSLYVVLKLLILDSRWHHRDGMF